MAAQKKFRIKTGDTVVVRTGKDKGRTGEVTQIHSKTDRVTVAGINMVSRHQKQTQSTEGGIIRKEAPIHVSNVALVDPEGDGATRVGYRMEDGEKVRFAKRSGAVIE